MADEKPDRIQVLGEAPGGGQFIVHQQGDRQRFGVATVIKEGQPLATGTALVSVNPIEGHPDLYASETLYEPEAPIKDTKGPAQVATKAYRDGWGNIFGKKQSGKEEWN